MSAHPTPEVAAATPVQEDRNRGSELIAPDCRGLNFYTIDPALRGLLDLYWPAPLKAHMEPHLQHLGALAGGRLDELAEQADKHPPELRPRDRVGRDEPWIDYHPAYREMEQIAFGEFEMHAMTHRGVLGWPEPLPPVAKYTFQYLFSQAEFGLMCPISVTDTSIHVLKKFAEPDLLQRLLPRMLEGDPERLWKGTQFMTEKAGGSDVSGIDTRACPEGDHWRLWGDKWFCSHTDGDVALLLARPEGAPAGTRGLALFAMPWRLEDGQRNAYRIVRLKDKLGTRSMASGEIKLEGAFAWPVGDLERGLKNMLEQVNLSRLSHGVRAAGMMRRCLNESLQVARYRSAFGRRLIELPLLRRQLVKLMVPTEQALSMAFFTAETMAAADEGEPMAAQALRILTGLLKLRACRDNIRVATGAMEVRGGNGYIEDWVNARLVRDAHLGVLWEGTSNINALDVIRRAVGKLGAQEELAEGLHERLSAADGAPAAFRGQLRETLQRASTFAAQVAAGPQAEPLARQAATALYNAASAAVLAWEGARLGASGGDARRLLLARLVLAHRLSPRDPLSAQAPAWETEAEALLLNEAPVSLEQASHLVTQG